jgi:uncharacterized hydrophobic protein (TIGR00271 family)
VIHLRLVVPPDVTPRVVDLLRDDPRVTHILVLPGVAVRPRGDAVSLDVAREAASDVLAALREVGVDGEDGRGGIAIEQVDAAVSATAEAAERAAPGSPDDGIVWEVVIDRARGDARSSWSFYAFLALATTIAAVAVLTDSAVLVVGAMVVGPEFGPVSAVAVGLALRRYALVGQALRLLAAGFGAAVAVTAVLALAVRAAGWVQADDLLRPRPMTAFIWAPDRWSFVVALLAGCAGVLSLTAGRSNVLVGVFISVTTVPAAGNLALALALWVPEEVGGSVAQLGLNLGGMTLAGTALLAVQRLLTGRFRAPAAPRPRGPGRLRSTGPDRPPRPRP